MPSQVIWWKRDDAIQNFGDYLSAIFWDELSDAITIPADAYYLIGSVISDPWIEVGLNAAEDRQRSQLVFWGCGLRNRLGIAEKFRRQIIFCAVRGPLTRTVLKLPDETPIGDTGLLLPIFYDARHAEQTASQTICVPHISDWHSDEELIAHTGVDRVIRPGIEKSMTALKGLIDRIASAKFVLAGSLHAAIIACAYGVPFCFFDSGYVDIPFKWRDFSQSIGIPTCFAQHIADGKAIYDTILRDRIQLPSLSALLLAGPFKIGPDLLARAEMLERRTSHRL